MSRLYSPVFTGVCLSLVLVTYTAIAPGWQMAICMAALLAVAISSLIITVAARILFVLPGDSMACALGAVGVSSFS